MKIGVCGICGRMGVAILRILLERGHVLGAAFDREGLPAFGSDAGSLIQAGHLNVAVGAISGDAIAGTDGCIDFSTPAATMKMLEVSLAKKKPLVIGTTALSESDKKEIERASRTIPVLLSPNMSLGVNLLFRLSEVAAKALSDDYDIEIFEAHHRFKKDAPSGTARRLLEIIRGARPSLQGAREVSGREGLVGERGKDEIGVLAMRGGDIVGEHTVFFNAIGERIELTHRLGSREPLARGAVLAMEFLYGRPAGLYSMFDVLGL
ncbi:MAG: 4-hydroxy-tetrahydrodipicolinate reductase [Spirochaetes bacterium]|nr:4-hydroxy-tetrahydrodipicolinate reductase [Spirochaetota bacterium]